MLGLDIDLLLEGYKSSGSFLGVLANGESADFPVNSYCVVNTASLKTATSQESGSALGPFHWGIVGRFSDFQFEIFDPQPMLTSKFFYLLKGLRGSVIMNNQVLMPTDSDNQTNMMCGEFVCYFFVKRQENLDLDFSSLLNVIFTTDPAQNAIMVNKFMEELRTSKERN